MNNEYILCTVVLLKLVGAGVAMAGCAAVIAKLDEKFGWNFF